MIKADHLIRQKSRPSDLNTVKARKKELRLKGKDPQLLSYCEDLWMNFSDFREQRRRGNQFYDGDQWSDLITVNGKTMTYRQYLTKTGNVVIQTNQIKNRVDTIVGLRVKEKSEPVCHAIDIAEQPYGTLVTEGVQVNCDKNIMSELESKSMRDVCNGGLACLYESYDDTSGPERRLDSWTQYINPNWLFFDADGVDPRFWDLSIIGCVRHGNKNDMLARFAKSRADVDVLKAIYPNQFALSQPVRSEDKGERQDNDGLVFMDTSDPTRCYYCEVWTLESRPKIKLWDKNIGIEEDIDPDDNSYRALVKEENLRRRELARQSGWSEEETPYITGDGFGTDDEKDGFYMDSFWYCRMLAPDGTILWEGESPYPDRLHPFTLCIFSYIDGKIIGYNNDAIDHQIAMNRAYITYEWLTRLQAKGVVVVPKDIVPKDVGYKEFARSWTAIDDMVFVDIKPGMEKMMPQVFYGAAQHYDVASLIKTVKELMDSGSPVNGALQGKDPGRATSGTLYAQMTTNASTPVAAVLEQFRTFIRQALIKKMKNLCTFYEPDRWRKIAGRIDSMIDYSTLNLNNMADIDLDLRMMESADSPQNRDMQEQDLANFLTAGLITWDEYTQVSRKPYVDKLRQIREAHQAEMNAAQEAGVPVAGTGPTAATPVPA